MSDRTMDIEALVARRLGEACGVRACVEVPAERPVEFISVERTGGGGTYMEQCQLAVQAWAATRRRAREIMSLACAAAADLDEEPNIFAPQVEAVYRFPDPDSRAARYQATVSLWLCE